MRVVVILFLYFASCFSAGFFEPDPCLPINHWILPIDGSRNSNCRKLSPKCDHYLDSGWYRTPNATIATTCPALLQCGFTYPVWMDGTHPDEAEGIVNRTGCMVMGSNPGDCCSANTTNTIRLKNCTNFFVYFLEKRPGCDEGYCFDSNLPCPTTTSTMSTAKMTSSLLNTGAKAPSKEHAEDNDSLSDLTSNQIVAIAIGIAVFLAFVTVGVFAIIYIKSQKVQPQTNLSTVVVAVETKKVIR